jgi:inosine-uridine nucleoside N-ribohydrolase
MKNKRIPVILDTDIGFDIDDTWALGFLLKCPELDVKLITTTSDNTLLKARLVAKFLELVDRTDIPIGIGPQENDEKGVLFDWVKDYELSQYPGTIYKNGVNALCSTVMKSPDPLTLIAIGPLGTVSEALKENPNIIENSRFVGMHGSIYQGYGGRESTEDKEEYNVKKNIQACKEVFEAAWEKTITPLDTCGKIILSRKHYESILETNDLIANLIKDNYAIWKTNMENQYGKPMKENQTSVLYDTVAIYLGFSEEFLNIEELPIEVTSSGLTIISENGNLIRCAISWKDLDAFKALLVDRLIH